MRKYFNTLLKLSLSIEKYIILFATFFQINISKNIVKKIF